MVDETSQFSTYFVLRSFPPDITELLPLSGLIQQTTN